MSNTQTDNTDLYIPSGPPTLDLERLPEIVPDSYTDLDLLEDQEEEHVKVYGYDTVDGSYINVYYVLESKFDPNSKWYTVTKLPDIPEGYTAVYKKSYLSWEVVEDHRGELVYDQRTGEKVIVDYLGPIKDMHNGSPYLTS